MFRCTQFRWIQAVSLLGLSACAFSASDRETESQAQRQAEAAHDPFSRLVAEVPVGCAVGSSGPTLNPGNSIRYARLSAVEALAEGSLEIDVQTISGIGPNGSFELASQALSGTLANARVRALWADVDDASGGRRRVRQVFALLCWPNVVVQGLPEPGYPPWLLALPGESDRICAVGIAGPTRKRSAQSASALREGRLAIAVALESRIEKRILDQGRGVAKIARQVDPSTAALGRAATASELESEWYDDVGRGPIGLPGVLYGLVCIED